MENKASPALKRSKHKDIQGTLLMPNSDIGERGVLNCSVADLDNSWPKPILIRARMIDNDREYSQINLAHLYNPTSISQPKPLITPTEKYESGGCEDPHIITKGDTHYITYVAVSHPNAQIALATANKDFSKITKHGIISPNISLEKAIELVPSQKYKKMWQATVDWSKKESKRTGIKLEPKLYVKDGLLHKERDVWYFIYRIEPDAQIAMVTDLESLHDDDFWRKEIQSFEDRTFMKGENAWEKLKIGIGALYDINGKHLGLYHGVSGKKTEPTHLKYKGSLFLGDFHGNRFDLEARLRNPLLIPSSEDAVLIEPGEKGDNKKAISFPTAAVLDPEDPDTLFLYYGVGDKEIGFRTTSLGWVIKELGNSHNKEEVHNIN